MLEWRVFAQKHNAKYPGDIQCWYEGMKLDPMDKAEVYEFPGGDPGADPDLLINEEHRVAARRPKHQATASAGNHSDIALLAEGDSMQDKLHKAKDRLG
jgi:hypothetical protein